VERTPLHRECRDTEIARARRGVTLRSYYVLSFDFAGPNRADALTDGPREGDCMRRFFTASLFVALAFAPSPTFAGKRTGDGALDAVAGAVVGFSNHIAHTLGLRSSPHSRTRSASAAAPTPRPDAAPSVQAPAPERATRTVALPPAQSLE
jgi:hypothetical protein